jgi:hypothetical protein
VYSVVAVFLLIGRLDYPIFIPLPQVCSQARKKVLLASFGGASTKILLDKGPPHQNSFSGAHIDDL